MRQGPDRVRKRDGRVVPFDSRKIAAAIGKAFGATGEGDPQLAGELSEVVTMALSRLRPTRAGGWVPTIEEIQDLVERVLMETGYSRTAKAYILYRDKRAKIRESVSVRQEEDPEPAKSSGGLRVERGRGGSRPWSKGRIVAALMQEADLTRETADEIASRVERRVFASGILRLSTTLIRELVDNELFGMGLEGKRRRQTLIGIPKYDFGQLLRTGFLEEDGEPRGTTLDPALAATRRLIECYALEDILPQEGADRHREGGLHFSNLGRVDRDLSAAFRTDSLAASLPREAGPAEAAQEIASLAASLLRQVSGPVILERADHWLSRFSGAASGGGRFQEELGGRLDLLRAAGGEILLSLPLDSPLRRKFPALTPRAGSELVWVGPGLYRGVEEATALIVCGAAASLNLPRIAYTSGPWSEEKLLGGLVTALETALRGLQALADFQKKVRSSRTASHAPGRVSYAVSLEGLVEAVRFSREGAFEPDLARTVRTAAADFLRDASVRCGLSLVLEDTSIPEAATRFARLDFDRFPQSRSFLAGPVLSYQQGMAP